MDTLHEEIDDLNEETFGSAEAGDWELEHEKFALAQTENEHVPPDANELPRFWESSSDVSFLWHPGALDSYRNVLDDGEKERGVDVEETLHKLVSEDEAFDDPAILDISKKAAEQKLCGSALEKILGAPAYPTASVNILEDSRDIWSSINGGFSSVQLGRESSGSKPTPNNYSIVSLLKDIARTTQNYNRTTHGIEHKPYESHHQSAMQSKLTSLPDDSCYFPFLPPAPPGQNYSHPPTQGISAVLPGSCFIRNTEHYRPPIQLAPSRLPTQIPILRQEFTQPPPPPPPPNSTPLYANQLSSVNPRGATLPFLMMNSHNTKLSPDLLNARQLSSLTPTNLHTSLTPPVPPPFNLLAQTLNVPSYLGPSFMQAFNSRLRFFSPQTIPPLRTSFTTQPGVFISSSPTSKMESNCNSSGIDPYSDEPFDPDTGSWMTQYESVGVLLMYLRPLMVSNPYIQDYYFAVRWLRQMAQNRVKQMSNGTLPQGCPPPIMHMPSPVTVDDLIDPSQYCRTSLSRRFVVPLVSLPSLHRCLSPSISTQIELTDGHSPPSKDAPKFPLSYTSSSPQSQFSTSETGSVLGRPTRASLNCPRIVAEVSLVSALADNSSASPKNDQFTPDEQSSQSANEGFRIRSNSTTKSTRRRLLLMARIERMYSLVLHIDEIDVSLARVVVENDTRNKLLHYKQQVLNRLLKEFVLSSTTVKSQSDTETTTPEVPSYMELLSIRKGAQLFSSILTYLPQPWIHICLSDFLLHFEDVHRTCLSVTEDYHSVLFPNLRRVVYLMDDIESFMRTCFPEVPQCLKLPVDISPRIITIVTTTLGISLILCLLDTCARLSKPDDPSVFVRYISYFVYVTTAPSILNAAQPITSFPHLASIVPLYVKPSIHSPITCSQVDRFCCLIDHSLKSSATASTPIVLSTNTLFTESDQSSLEDSKNASLLRSTHDTTGVHIAPLLAS